MGNKVGEIITDEQLIDAFAHSNFDEISKREVLRVALLKCACGHSMGYTIRSILVELSLVRKSTRTLTPKGKEYLWASYSEKISV